MNYLKCPRAIFFASMFLVLAAAASIGAFAQGSAQRKALTVESIYGEPGLNGQIARSLTWTPDGKAVAFLLTAETAAGPKTELWQMDAATGEKRVLISAEKLKALLPRQPGLAKQSTGAGRRPSPPFQFSPDGASLLFQTQNSLIWYDRRTQSARTLALGQEPFWDAKISPDGKRVSYVFEHNVWLANVSNAGTSPLTRGGTEALRKGDFDWVYPEELEIKSGHWWAPDSSAIAYTEMDVSAVTQYPIQDEPSNPLATLVERYARAGEPNAVARVLVAPLDGSEPRAMNIGVDKECLIARVAWLPDGKHLAIQRFNRLQSVLNLLIADTTTGQSRVALTETDPHYVNFSDILYFFKDSSRFIWSSERSGFRHLYLYKTVGGEIAQITQGDWEVTALDAVDEARGLVYFTATEKNPLERQLYRIHLDGTGLERVSREDGTHAASFSPRAETDRKSVV